MSANGKLLLGRKLVVTYAHHAPTDADGVIRPRKTMMETGRPTTLSMLKSSTGWKHKDGFVAVRLFLALVLTRMAL